MGWDYRCSANGGRLPLQGLWAWVKEEAQTMEGHAWGISVQIPAWRRQHTLGIEYRADKIFHSPNQHALRTNNAHPAKAAQQTSKEGTTATTRYLDHQQTQATPT